MGNIAETPEIIVNGHGSDLNNSKIINRAKKKLITQKTVLSLIDVAKRLKQTDMLQSYWNTYHCQGRLFTNENKMYGTYCKNRFCTVCTSIRKAHFINRYLPIINQWDNPHFVTLTIKSCAAPKLRFYIKSVLRAFNEILAKYKKRHQRGTSFKLILVRSLECNFNQEKRTYNPHLHIIVPNKETGDILVKEWLKKWTSGWTYKGAQKNVEVYSNEKALIEIIKYGSKIFTEPDLEDKRRSSGTAFIYVAALNNILRAMKRQRIFERSGFNLSTAEGIKSKASKLTLWEEWRYKPKYRDWLNTDGCQLLLGYEPTQELLDMLEENIDYIKS